jgi:glucokinase
MGDLAIGIDLGGTAVKVGLVDSDEHLVSHLILATEAADGPEHVIDRIVEGIEQLSASSESLSGIGIGAPGSVSLDRTTVSAPPNFPGWGSVNLSQIIQGRIGADLAVIVDNDANAAALGSAYFGAGRSFDSFLMVTLGTGVGGAIIYNRRLFRGTSGGAGEIGHISIDFAGPPAAAGIAGVIEAYLGQRFLSHHAAERLTKCPDSSLHDMALTNPEHLTPLELFEAATAGDLASIEILAWAGHKLGWGLGSAVNLLDIRKVVVGGGVSAAGDFILEPARVALRKAVIPGLTDGLEIIQETLGNQVGILGAAQLAFNHSRSNGVT